MMSRIIVPGEPPPKPERLLSPELVSREFLRLFKSELELERLRRIEELRRSMPRQRE